MKFSQFADYLYQLEKTSSRLKIMEILAELFKKADKNEIDKICYLSLGRLAPQYAGIEFNLADKLLVRAIAKAFYQPDEIIKKKYKEVGDLGEVVYKFKNQNAKLKFSVDQVYEKLLVIAKDSGEGSVERKINGFAELISDLDALSSKYIVRIPLGRLRLGFSELTIMDALSWMLVGNRTKRKEIEEAYNVRADIGQIAKLVKFDKLKSIKVQLGTPVVSALCQRLPNPEEMIKKMGQVAAEPKYDGTRLQLHFDRNKKTVSTFTRNLENNSLMFPDIIEMTSDEVKANQVVLDGEAIAYDQKTGRFLPFQETIKRKRKYDIDAKAKEIPLKYFVFDVLYHDGQDLLKTPFTKRRQILEKIIPKTNKTIVLSPQIITDNASDLRKFHDLQKANGLEGIVVKKVSAPYDPGRRGYTWVKFKEEETKKGGGLADTLDCLVMGYYKGKGKRTVFGIGAFLVGIRKSKNSDQFLTISKIGTGLTDEQWKELVTKSNSLIVSRQPKEYQVPKNLIPDVWCLPKMVVEIQADNITNSPIHTAGLALRFPRLVRFRDDKSADQSTTLSEATKLYKLQK